MTTLLPKDFDWKMYLILNKDLTGVSSENDAIGHYLQYGKLENRLYHNNIPKDFDWRLYIKLNTDLNYINNETEAVSHYLLYGIEEKRLYKIINYPNNNKIVNDYKKIIKNNKKILNNNDNEITNDCQMENNFNLNIVKHNVNTYDFLDEDDVLYTRLFMKDNHKYLEHNIDINILDSLLHFVLVVDFNNGGGGTTIFLNRIVSKYKNYCTFLILRYDGLKYFLNINEEYVIEGKFSLYELIEILEKYKEKIKKIFVNHLISHTEDLIKYIFDMDKIKIGITHDYYNIYTDPQPRFYEIKKCIKNDLVNINKYDILITQNKQNLEYFSEFTKRIDIVDLPDFKLKKQYISSNNNKKVCCLIGNINKIKGKNKFIKILNHLENYKDIEFIVIGYIEIPEFKNQFIYNNINEFNDLIQKYRPNIIVELTDWPETYSYTLTMSMLTDLPILYFKKPTSSVVKDRLKNYKKSYEFYDIKTLFDLINKYSQNYFYTINETIFYDKFWNDLFIDRKIKYIENKKYINYNIKPYFIYFPQFHEIFENNFNYYKGYSDITNLKLYNNTNQLKKIEIPLEEYCNINNYDYVLNDSLIKKQIDLINYYDFSGIAMYYYWFTINEMTEKNMIMENVIDIFFSKDIKMENKKIFFIWANEDWTNNLALSPTINKKIINIYDKTSFEKNANNLITYFKNEKYLKINNKPVLFIYHSYLIDNIDEFYNILNVTCIKNGFAGVHLVLNSFIKTYEKYKNFYVNFNYKKYDCRYFDEKNDQILLDYSAYSNDKYHIKKNKIQTIVFDFNNQVRLYKPNKLKNSTICKNNTELMKTVFSKNIINLYKDNNPESELDNILLVNAFNEWGEKMSFEPSDKYGYYNINLLYELLRS